ncbi:MAG: glycoside hydrolase family 97 catalytic domain-containing protein [Prolixibacteraceae bacterium]|nr:glycoside hydrolase family 97 catalytic domain-containing protein [Prolixibacteraceae bacterium]
MRNTIILTIITVIIVMSFFSCYPPKDHWELKSPNQQLNVKITQQATVLHYELMLNENGKKLQAIEPSPLGIVREDNDFSTNLTFKTSTFKKNIKEEYRKTSGKKLECTTAYNELTLDFVNPENQWVKIIFRAFDDGIAFCYEFPENNEKYVRILKETSGFNLPDGHAWMHAYDTVSTWAPGYETYYEGPMPIGTPAPLNKNGWAFPALFETNEKVWVLISESGFDGTYVASHLDVTENGTYLLRNPEKDEAMGFYENTSYAKLPLRTPWRVIAATSELNTLLNSNLTTDLATPCVVDDLTWIKPGRASWSWWYDNDSPQDYQLMLPYIDMASELGWEYFLVDANWNTMKNGTLNELAVYAKNKGVGLLLWYNSGGKHNVVTEGPRDLMDDRSIRRKEFQRIHEIGIKGIKVDFFQSDKQRIIKQYIDILEDAAEFQLLVNFHGCTLPKGWRRTYPNLVGMEAIRGGECYIFDPLYPEKAPSHLAIAAFSRGVIGPSDYTPGGFANNTYPFKTTLAFELALPIIFESGITHFVDPPAALNEQPAFVIDFLKNIPVVWDELIYLDGYPGEYLVMARRNGENWYLAAMNAKQTAQLINIDLTPLSISDQLTIITEGDESRTLQLKNVKLNKSQLQLEIKPLGGFVGTN